MARAAQTDFLQAFRFHVRAVAAGSDPQKFLARSGTTNGQLGADAGFAMVSTPSGNIDLGEYREGHYIYTRKQPGIPTMDAITMSRGVTLSDSQFYYWFRTTIEGDGEYRADLEIVHYARRSTQGTDTLTTNPQGLNADSTANKLYTVYEAFPTSFKPATDLDANASEIAIAELTADYERFEVTGVDVPDARPRELATETSGV